MDYICRARLIGGKSVKYESLEARGSTIEQIIENDRNFGFLKPKNGKYYTVALKNTDIEISYSDAKKAIIDGWMRWELWNEVDFKWSNDFENADIRFEFRSESEDSILDSNTIAYMYYPIAAPHLRGLCVINKRFIYTNHGKPVTGKYLLERGIDVQFPEGQYVTIDLDKIVGHEKGHGVFGLPHDPEPKNTMSSSEGKMSEFLSWRDIKRSTFKAGMKNWSERQRWRFMRWFYGGATER